MDEINIPHDDQTEAAVLGAILLDPSKFADVARILNPEDFYVAEHRKVFAAMKLLSESGTDIDLITVHDASKVPASEVSTLMDGVPKALNVAHYAKIVWRHARMRAQMHAADKILGYITSGGQDLNVASEWAAEILTTPADEKPTTDSAANVIDKLLEHVDAQQTGDRPVEAYSTHTKRLDAIFKYRRQKLYIFAGRPSMGKTAFALNQIIALGKQGLSGLLFEQEMPAEEIAMRMASSISRVDFGKILNASPEHPLEQDEWERLAAAHDTVKNEIDLEICDLPSRSIDDVRNEILRINRRREAEGKKPLDYVVFDYIQIAYLPTSGGMNRVNAIGHFTSTMKNLAREFDMIAIALSQLSRQDKKLRDKEGVPPMPCLDDLRDSGNIEQDADLVAFFHRPEFYLKTQGHPVGRWENVAQVSVAKQRGGATGLAPLAFRGEIMTFTDPWWDEEEENGEEGPEGQD